MSQYGCPRCGAVFGDRDSFRDHARTCEGGEGGSGEDPQRKYTCGVCGQMFSTATARAFHQERCERNAEEEATE